MAKFVICATHTRVEFLVREVEAVDVTQAYDKAKALLREGPRVREWRADLMQRVRDSWDVEWVEPRGELIKRLDYDPAPIREEVSVMAKGKKKKC